MARSISKSSTSHGEDCTCGINDILSMALEQSGFDMLLSPTQSFSENPVTVPPPLLTDDSFKMITESITTPSTSVSETLPLILTPSSSVVNGSVVNIDLDNMVDCLSSFQPTEDLSVLLNETAGVDYLETFVSKPSARSITMSTPLPASRTSKLTALGAGKSNNKVGSDLSVDDVLLQLGLDANNTPTPSLVNPVSLASISGMIGSVSVTHLDKTSIK